MKSTRVRGKIKGRVAKLLAANPKVIVDRIYFMSGIVIGVILATVILI